MRLVYVYYSTLKVGDTFHKGQDIVMISDSRR